MSTIHNEANYGDIAKVVLMPGDPLRAKWIAENMLENAVCFNEIRGMLGYTGTYKGHRVSVMGSGMGMPSIGIYSYELFKYYGVETIIRIGSTGSYSKDLKIKDIVLVTSSYSESRYAIAQANDFSTMQYPDEETNYLIQQVAGELSIPIVCSRTHSSDVFYYEGQLEHKQEMVEYYDAKCIEMESFALFHNAKLFKKKAACLLTVSDDLLDYERISPEERIVSFKNMFTLALESAIRL